MCRLSSIIEKFHFVGSIISTKLSDGYSLLPVMEIRFVCPLLHLPSNLTAILVFFKERASQMQNQ